MRPWMNDNARTARQRSGWLGEALQAGAGPDSLSPEIPAPPEARQGSRTLRDRIAIFRDPMGRRGVAALEFALAAPLLIVMAGGFSDLGRAQIARSALANGVAAGAEYAMIVMAAGTTPTQANITSVVQKSSGLPNAATTVVVTYPGSSFNWYCVTGSTGTASTYTASSSGGVCSDGTAAGYYLTINASCATNGIITGFVFATGMTMSEQVTARIK